MIDDRTPNLNLAKPNLANTLLEDVARLRSALDTLDTVVSGKQATIGYTPANAADKGAAGGLAPLGGDGKVPSAYLPSYVDDVLEYANFAAFPATGEAGKIYIALNTNAQYRWGGSAYTQITQSPGTTDNVPEGAANLYFTAQRARDAQLPATSVTPGVMKVGSGLSVSGDGTVSLDIGTSFTETVLTPGSNGQTAFVVDGGYISGSVQVLLNGVELLRNDDYTATDGVNITLAQGVNTTDRLLVRTWRAYLNTGPVSIPAAPVNTSPAAGATVSELRPTFSGGVFSAPDGATHSATQLQISTASNFSSTVYDSGSLAGSTSVKLPAGTISPSTTYYWRMRYQSSGGQWSAWSTPTTFTTAASLANYIDTPAATPGYFGAPFEGGYYAGLIWNQVTQSATSTTIGTGSKTFTTSDNMAVTPLFYLGQQVEVRSLANPANKMFGTVTFAGSTTLTVNVGSVGGSGTFTDWSVMARFRVIVAPKASGESSGLMFKNSSTSDPEHIQTPSEGLRSTAALISAGTAGVYPASWFCKDLNAGGFSDWYLPSFCEIELAYRNLKPSTTSNLTGTRSGFLINGVSFGEYTELPTSSHGSNSNSDPNGGGYSASVPGQVAAGLNFRTGESEAFDTATSYWISGANGTSDTQAGSVSFSNGLSNNRFPSKMTLLRVRAVRRSII